MAAGIGESARAALPADRPGSTKAIAAARVAQGAVLLLVGVLDFALKDKRDKEADPNSRAVSTNRKMKTLLVLGVAYKADIDDTRESPSLDIMETLRLRGARIEYSDPYVPTRDWLSNTPQSKFWAAAYNCIRNPSFFLLDFVAFGCAGILFGLNFAHDFAHNTVFVVSRRVNCVHFQIISR